MEVGMNDGMEDRRMAEWRKVEREIIILTDI